MLHRNRIVVRNKINNTISNIEAEAVLVAVGRHSIETLNVSRAGISITERGGIQTDEYIQTSPSHIGAMGDVTDRERFIYISRDDSRIVSEVLKGNKQKSTLTRTSIPYTVFIDLPLARVGMSEKKDNDKGIAYVVETLPAEAIQRTKLLNETDGLLKLMVNKQDGKIIGRVLFYADLHEKTNGVSAVMKLGTTYTFLRDFIFTHPIMGESLNDLCDKIKI